MLDKSLLALLVNKLLLTNCGVKNVAFEPNKENFMARLKAKEFEVADLLEEAEDRVKKKED